MSGVVAVIDRYWTQNDLPADLLEARQAVAELVEDAALALELLESEGLGDGYTAGLLRASIARVGGAA